MISPFTPTRSESHVSFSVMPRTELGIDGTQSENGLAIWTQLLLLRRLAAHTFRRLGLAGDSDIRTCDLSGVASAGDAAVGPLGASRQLRLHRRIARRHNSHTAAALPPRGPQASP